MMKKLARTVAAFLLVTLLVGSQTVFTMGALRIVLLNAAAVGGGRRDINFGNHGNSVIVLEAQLTEETRVMFFDRNYNEIGATTYQATGSLSGGTAWYNKGHTIYCSPSVYHIAFFLDTDKRALVYKIDEW